MFHKKTTEDFILDAKSVHGDRYDYSITDYKNTRTKVKIRCKKHGVFDQIPKLHLRGRNCDRCAKEQATKTRISKIDFITRANKIHDFIYDYSYTKYTGMYNKVKIICSKHGVFSQVAKDHLSGCGCQKCGCNNISKAEKKWLDLLNVPYRQHNIGKCIVDGFDPKTNTVYEFYGDFWHGNPKKYKQNEIHPIVKKSFRDLYESTLKKEKYIKNKGYKLICVWESEVDLDTEI